MLPPNAMSTESAPLLSVIVVCKNPGLRLRETLASVWAQIALPPELIVVDGGSEDGSRVWLASQRAKISTLIMEPDTGVYDAMNKGLAVAHGDWVLFLGADDRLFHDAVFSRVQAALKQAGDGVAVAEVSYEDGRTYQLAKKPKAIRRNFMHHQGAFYRRSLFAEHGNFDAKLAIMGDYDLNVRLLKKNVKFTAVPFRLTTCGVGGLSDAGNWQGYEEEIAVRHRHFSALACWPWDLGSVIRFVRKQFVAKKRTPAEK